MGNFRPERFGEKKEAVVRASFPKGVPFTREAFSELADLGVDVLRFLSHHTPRDVRRACLLHSLDYRQPFIVALLEQAGESEHADVVAALSFSGEIGANYNRSVLERAKNPLHYGQNDDHDALKDTTCDMMDDMLSSLDLAWGVFPNEESWIEEMYKATWPACLCIGGADTICLEVDEAEELYMILDLVDFIKGKLYEG